MINTLKKSLEIDITYSINSFIYLLSKLPILKHIISNNLYKDKVAKKVISIIMILFYIIRSISIKFLYFFIIFSMSYYYFPNNLIKTYFHVYFLLTILGMFINNKLLNTTKKKYISMILFNMDATNYFKSELTWNLTTTLLLDSICILFFGYLISCPLSFSIILILFTIAIRVIGEYLNIMFYKKKNYIWYTNNKLYVPIMITFILLIFLPFVDIYININAISIISIITIIISIKPFLYLWNLKDYKLIYKKLSSVTDPMNSKFDKDYLTQAMVNVIEKDKIIDNRKIENKKGYDFFNTIFFERHKHILIRSAKKYSFILIGIYIVLIYLLLTSKTYYSEISNFLENNLGWFVVIMYFINRGAIITQAMFFNCDHAMLNYNFYREKEVILGLFKKRLLTITKVNLIPALVIGVGNSILLIMINSDITTIITTFLFIIFLSIFFSVHYLVIYYLFQPFNKNMEVKKMSYSIVTLLTYIVSYQMTSVVINSSILSILGLLVTIIYIVLGLFLISKLAPKTFKLN